MTDILQSAFHDAFSPFALSFVLAAIGLWLGWDALQRHFPSVFFVEHASVNLLLAFAFGRTLRAVLASLRTFRAEWSSAVAGAPWAAALAALRQEVEPVTQAAYGRFLPRWQGATGLGTGEGERLRGTEGVLRAVEQLSGARLPASAVETLVLPARRATWRRSLACSPA